MTSARKLLVATVLLFALGLLSYFVIYRPRLSPIQDPYIRNFVISLRDRTQSTLPKNLSKEKIKKYRNQIKLDQREKWDALIIKLEEALSIQPNNFEVLGLLGRAYGGYASFTSNTEELLHSLSFAQSMATIPQLSLLGNYLHFQILLRLERYTQAKKIYKAHFRELPSEDLSKLAFSSLSLLDPNGKNWEHAYAVLEEINEDSDYKKEALRLQALLAQRLGLAERALLALEARLRDSPYDAFSLTETARIYHLAGRHKEAITWLQEGLTNHSYYVEARLLLAHIYLYNLKRRSKSQVHLSKILSTYSLVATENQLAQAKASLAFILDSQNKTKSLKALFNEGSSNALNYSAFKWSKAYLLSSGRDAEASLFSLSAYDSISETILGTLHQSRGQIKEAKQYFTQALLYKDIPLPLPLRALIYEFYLSNSFVGEAQSLATQSINRPHILHSSNFELSAFDQNFHIPSPTRLQKIENKLAKLRPSSAHFSFVGLTYLHAYLQNKNASYLKKAQRYFLKSNALLDTFEPNWIYLSMIALHQGQFKKAEKRLNRALSLAPDHPASNYWLAKIYTRQKKLRTAKAFLKIPLNDEHWRKPSQVLMGQILEKQGQVEEAQDLFQSAASFPAYLPAWKALLSR